MPKSARNLFTVVTPLGDSVVLSRNRWREIIRFKHPAMRKYLADVKSCLESPELICESVKDSEVHLYYRRKSADFICVVVSPETAGIRFVITAYLTERIKSGVELWKK